MKKLLALIMVMALIMLAVPASADPVIERDIAMERPGWVFPVAEDQAEAPEETPEDAPVQTFNDDLMKQDFLDNDTKDDIYDLLIFVMVLSLLSTAIGAVTAALVVRGRR